MARARRWRWAPMVALWGVVGGVMAGLWLVEGLPSDAHILAHL